MKKYSAPLFLIAAGLVGLVARCFVQVPTRNFGFYGPGCGIGVGLLLAWIIWRDERPPADPK